MKNFSKIRIFFMVVYNLISLSQFAGAYELSTNLLARTYPSSANVEAQAKFNSIIWDKRQNDNPKWFFGLFQPQITLSAAGMLEGGVSFFPIGLIELGASKSVTSRYYETKPFNCNVVTCKGVLERNKLFVRMIVGTELEFGSLFLVLSATSQTLETGDRTLMVVDEVEKLLTSNGEGELRAQSIFSGVKINDQTFGLHYRAANFRNQEQKNESFYLIYRKPLDDWKISIGLGSYASTYFDKSISGLIGFTYAYGKNEALF